MLRHYLAVALRNLARTPLASAMHVVTLAIGIACFVAVYAFVAFWSDADAGFANAERIAVITTDLSLADDSFSFENDPKTPEHASKYLAEDFPALERVARAVPLGDETIVAADARSLRVPVVAADAAWLEMFDLPFVAGDARRALAAPRSAVITTTLASRLFGTESPLGRTMRVANVVDATVTGVTEPVPEPSHMGRSRSAVLKFDLLVSFDVHEAVDASRRPPNARAARENWLASAAITYVLLPADGSFRLADLRAGLKDFARRRVPPEIAGFAAIELGAAPVGDLLGNAVNGGLFLEEAGVSMPSMLLALGALVLAVACVNYANLATARAARRAREVGLRKALGARRAQIATQHLLEVGLVTLAAFGVAIAAVTALLPVLDGFVGADLAPTLFSGARFWLMAAAAVAVVTLSAGAYPAFVLARVRPVISLRSGRALGSRTRSALLIGAQFMVASFLMVVVTITTMQNAHLARTGLGRETDPVLLIENSRGTTKVEPETLRQALARVPQVNSVAEIGAAPWVTLSGTLMSASDDPNAAAKLVIGQAVGLGFFDVFDIGVLAGRVFDAAHVEAARAEPESQDADEARPQAPQPVVVDRAFTAAFGFESPAAAVDRIVYYPDRVQAVVGASARPAQIVGVVEDRRFTTFGGFESGTVYEPRPRLDFVAVRIARDDVSGALAGIDRVWHELAPDVAIGRRFLDDYFNEVYENYLRVGQVVTWLASLAFAIAITGLFGMATLIAADRLREVAVRKAHGATNARMIAMLLAAFSKPVVVANLAAWPLAYVAGKAYLGVFNDPIPLTAAPFALSLAAALGIAWLAVGAQTLRAARARPAEVLRYE